MAKNGYRIFDSDTHVGPAADILEIYMAESERRRLDSWEPYKSIDKLTGHWEYTRGRRNYPRVLGTADGDINRPRTAVRKHRKESDMPLPRAETDPSERIKDMNREGVDVNLTLPSSWFGTFTAHDDVTLETAMYHAYHRWMADYCGAFPDRIKGVILACARDIAESLKEIERCAQEDWPLACMVYAPSGFPLDHPDLEPVWAACQHHDLSIALHTCPASAPMGQIEVIA
jgi:predicted TIM-barrel fold metal-dependent hydrolase